MCADHVHSLEGTIERITFHSSENGFCVLQVKCPESRDTLTVTGYCGAVHTGEYVETCGYWVNDRTYGRQFRATRLRVISPSTVEGMARYLGSGLISGIGPGVARVLVDGFGESVFDVIERQPERLLSLEGIGPKRLAKIEAAWAEQKAVRDIMVFLQTHDVGTARALRIYRTYGDAALDLIQENPYRLAADIYGIGFRTADKLGAALGIREDALIRIGAGLLHRVSQYHARGHCALNAAQVEADTAEMLGVTAALVHKAMEQEVAAGRLITEILDGIPCLYSRWLYYAEKGVAEQLGRLLAHLPYWEALDSASECAWVEKSTGLVLSSSQQTAVARALNNKVTCISGGPGVGKTTVLSYLLQIIAARGYTVELCAPTGRAARRLSESTGKKAYTIHRLLGYQPHNGNFTWHTEQPLDVAMLIVDEASMIDVTLMYQLLKALPDKAALVIVGDADQLPSVGPGQVLGDLIDSAMIPTIVLNEIFRQPRTSQIVLNAHRINAGQVPAVADRHSDFSDFYQLQADSPEAVVQLLKRLISVRIPQAFEVDPVADIQVLVPRNRGGLGVRALNPVLQALLNPQPEEAVTRFGMTFGHKDKVIQTLNNYEKGIFNGEAGLIEHIDHHNGELYVRFDAGVLRYDFSELDELELAYVTSIHKSQGSEYPVVIILLARQHYMMLQRNLLYTAVTRGKQLVVLLSEGQAAARAVASSDHKRRITALAQRLRYVLGAESVW